MAGVMAGLVNGSSAELGLDSINGTAGTGPIGFGGLGWEAGLSRWIQATEAPDLVLPEVVKFAQPIFFFLMLAEFCVSKYLGKGGFYFRQAVTNLGAAGTMYLVLGVFLRGMVIFPYVAVDNLFGLNKSEGFWSHVVAFLAVDIAHYVAHRWGHVSNSGWALHNMHHSAPDFNMVTSYRQAPDSLLINWLFYLPLAFFVPVKLFFLYYGILYAYQFPIHTELVGKLHPVIEYIFNTPSHHRVHHARNYPRANYGGMLIIWDRLFNTFVAERDDKPCVYGLDERQIPLGTHNPVWQQGHHIWYTMKGVIEAKGLEKFRVLFTRVHVEGMIAPVITDSNEDTVPMPPDGIPCDPRVSWVDPYVAVHGGLCILVSLYLLIQAAYLPPEQTIAICFVLLFSYTTMFTLMDESEMEKAAKNEAFRLVTVAAIGIWLLNTPLSIALSFFCLVSIFVVYTLGSESKVHEDQKHSDLDVDHFFKFLHR